MGPSLARCLLVSTTAASLVTTWPYTMLWIVVFQAVGFGNFPNKLEQRRSVILVSNRTIPVLVSNKAVITTGFVILVNACNEYVLICAAVAALNTPETIDPRKGGKFLSV